ncbi:hypothetical protein EG327_002435 [Venturia inaequalis]|uniref:Uncharacterized protein n=1 Tax=Venturia inaequalis TaxID=5025 RepID=A0A8H3Z8L5_VENIN|nr:hypothetical protein EG327_002435 [Venturia inaequalis]
MTQQLVRKQKEDKKKLDKGGVVRVGLEQMGRLCRYQAFVLKDLKRPAMMRYARMIIRDRQPGLHLIVAIVAVLLVLGQLMKIYIKFQAGLTSRLDSVIVLT